MMGITVSQFNNIVIPALIRPDFVDFSHRFDFVLREGEMASSLRSSQRWGRVVDLLDYAFGEGLADGFNACQMCGGGGF